MALSADHGATWTRSEWKFTESFGCPTFLNFGRNDAGARDEFVYVYSHDNNSAYQPADRMVLARVSKDRIIEHSAYIFHAGQNTPANPIWTSEIAQLAAMFTHTDCCYRSGISYNAALQRYLWCQIIPGPDTRFSGGLEIYDATEPWGPGPPYSSRMNGTSARTNREAFLPNRSATLAARFTWCSLAMIISLFAAWI